MTEDIEPISTKDSYVILGPGKDEREIVEEQEETSDRVILVK